VTTRQSPFRSDQTRSSPDHDLDGRFPVGQTRLEIPASPLGLFQHGWVVGPLAAQEPARDQLSDASGGDGAVIGRHRRFFATFRKHRPTLSALTMTVKAPRGTIQCKPHCVGGSSAARRW